MKQALSNQSLLALLGALTVTGCVAGPPDPGEDVAEAAQAVSVDPRRDLFAIAAGDTIGAHAAKAQLFGVQSPLVTHNLNGTYTLQTTPFQSLEDGTVLCSTTSFYNQPHEGGGATGVLVGPSLVLTAAHTLGAPSNLAQAQATCDSRLYIANYGITDPNAKIGTVTTRPAADVYQCTTVVYLDVAADVALVTLDRPVANTIPLKPRRSGVLSSTAVPAERVGYPHRLPAKIELGNIHSTGSGPHLSFAGQLHVAVGDSGAGVVNAQTGRVEGFIVTGSTATFFNSALGCTIECTDPALCPSTWQGSVAGPSSTEFASVIPLQGLEVSTPPDSASSGPPGGPFAKEFVTYTLSAGAAGMTAGYSVSVTGPLQLVDPWPPFKVAAGQTRNVTVQVDESATKSLLPGTYDSTVSITDTTYGTVDTFHHSIVITDPDQPGWCLGCGAAGCCGDLCCSLQ